MDFFIYEDAPCYSQILITEDEIFASSRSYDKTQYIDQFLNSPNDGISDVRDRIRIDDITKFTLVPADREIQLEYDKLGEEKDTELIFISDSDFKKASEILKSKTQLKGREKKIGLRPTLYSILGVLFFSAATYTFGKMAIEIENGTFVPKGRRVLMQRLFTWVIDLVGQTGVYIIGGILTLLFVGATVVNFKDRNKNIEVFE